MARSGRRVRTQNTRIVTLQVLTVAHTHTLDDPVSEASRVRRGDIILVMLTPPHATRDQDTGDWHWDEPINKARFGFVHVENVPETDWQTLRKRATEDLTVNNRGRTEEDPGEFDAMPGVARERRWRWRIPDMAGPKRNELLNDGETTYQWLGAEPLIRFKRYTDILDPDQDDDSGTPYPPGEEPVP